MVEPSDVSIIIAGGCSCRPIWRFFLSEARAALFHRSSSFARMCIAFGAEGQ
jgi:hypothetical protein